MPCAGIRVASSPQFGKWSILLAIAAAAASAPSRADEDAAAIQQAKSLSRAFRAAAKTVLPTVVEVKTTTGARVARQAAPRSEQNENPFRGTPFEDLFEDGGPRFHGVPDVPEPGLGSGVIIDPSGVILTNNHVVRDADEVVIKLSDGRQFKADDVRVDEKTDLAVVRINAKEPLPAARLGDSDKAEIGDWVLAVGNPFELDQTVSAGIISAKGRTLGAVGRAKLLQTDAAINPGNSGGPLVNLDGEVIGINTAIYSRSGGNQGIGFAIPVNLAKWITPQLIQRGNVQRAYLGVAIEPAGDPENQQFGVLPRQGVRISEVFEESPAAAAGLRKGDVILRFDGRAVLGATDLQEMVERTPDGSRHQVDILRDDKPATVPVVVRAMPDDFDMAARSHQNRPLGLLYQNRELGLLATDLNEELATQLGYEEGSGAVVVHVDRGRPAYAAGLREGMLIRRVGDMAVQTAAQLKTALESVKKGEGIRIEVQTHQGPRTLELKGK
ncbi:MAG: Do family serine endopeptidase [Pirellulales bacterium]|nr:Do family serine endopeptidase [Pirellulales bacterium]